MRNKNDCNYAEYKEDVKESFGLIESQPNVWTPEYVTNFILEGKYDGLNCDGPLPDTSEFLFFLSIGEYELKHDILEERIANGLGYHIYRYENMGRYKADLTEEEIAEVEKDIAYIKSNIILPELSSYEDKKWENT